MSCLPRTIVAAVDFGEASARAVTMAGLIAARCGAESLRLLHAEAVEAPAYFTTEQIEALEHQRQTTKAQAQRFLLEFGQRQTATPFAAIDDRTPIDAILHEAAEADLTVMGTHGRHGPQRWWLGSVAERTLREASRPLLIVRADAPRVDARAFDRLLVHAVGPLIGSVAMDYAGTLAERFSGTVVDGRYGLVEPALEASGATLLVVATPAPPTAAWLADFGAPLIRFCSVPILFVPETSQGASS